MKINKFYILLCLGLTFMAACKKKETTQTALTEDQQIVKNQLDTIIQPGDSLIDVPNPNASKRPEISADQRGFQGSTDGELLRKELKFLFVSSWEPKAKIYAGKNEFIKISGEKYSFNEDGTYTFTSAKGNVKGIWKGRIYNEKPAVVMVPDDKTLKTTEYTFNNVGKQMIWAGTSDYGDNAEQIMLMPAK